MSGAGKVPQRLHEEWGAPLCRACTWLRQLCSSFQNVPVPQSVWHLLQRTMHGDDAWKTRQQEEVNGDRQCTLGGCRLDRRTKVPILEVAQIFEKMLFPKPVYAKLTGVCQTSDPQECITLLIHAYASHCTSTYINIYIYIYTYIYMYIQKRVCLYCWGL